MRCASASGVFSVYVYICGLVAELAALSLPKRRAGMGRKGGGGLSIDSGRVELPRDDVIQVLTRATAPWLVPRAYQ